MADSPTEVADVLDRARRSGVALPGVEGAWDDFGLAGAYEVQTRGHERRVQRGATQVGWKIALTSAAARESVGASAAVFGRIYDEDRSDADVTRVALLAPLVEVELAVVLDGDLFDPTCTADDARTAVRSVHPAVEIADCRIVDWDVSLVDFVCDNAAAARWVVDRDLEIAIADVGACQARITAPGGREVEGGAADVMGDPFAALAWLAEEVVRRGGALGRGDVVLTGALTPPVPLPVGGEVTVELAAGNGPTWTRVVRR